MVGLVLVNIVLVGFRGVRDGSYYGGCGGGYCGCGFCVFLCVRRFMVVSVCFV